MIIGAGPGGLCTAIRLLQAGIRDFVILEKAAGVGGTWWHNSYPGAECDVPSHLYSFSFEPKDDWVKPFSTQPEIKAYLEHCVAKYGLTPHLRLETEVRSAGWEDPPGRWRIETTAGEVVHAPIVVSAIGMFNEPHWANVPGLDRFEGTLFHSARWNHDHDLNGERVATIGSAASATQFVPEIAKQAGQLYVFQRSANWVLPKEDDPFDEEALGAFRADAGLVSGSRQQIFEGLENLIQFDDQELIAKTGHVHKKFLGVVVDPEVRRKLTPRHPYGCKRPLLSNDYYPAFNRPNVELVTEGIAGITDDAIETTDGKLRRVDTIVMATGFETTKYLSAIEVRGRDGLQLEDAWRDGAQAYLGITTSGFPNLFMLYGPNTNNGSILFMLECQVDYVMRQLERMQARSVAWIDVRREVMDSYNEALQRELDGVDVWHASCNGYYRGPSGRIVTQWPRNMTIYRERTQADDTDAYEMAPIDT
ncbi:MAG: NAD(P)/FAD-dependent oxidoreductase [Myxococcota bacterium]|nr:NAD(P)/FAD-dependent oxidoreductase [Myxococcota bacterium]